MKNKKLLLSGLGTVLAISSVAPISMLSTSCSAESRFGAIGGEYDKEFGVSSSTYKTLKTSFWSAYKAKLMKDPATASSENIAREKTRLFNTFNTFDNKLKRDKTISYTLATESLIEYANKYFDIKLKRDNTANKSDIYKLFDGTLNSVKAYMDGNPEAYNDELKQLIINNANNEFYNNLLPNLENKYKDPLSILIQLRSQMATCFADLNSTVSLISSTLRLKQFISDYKIEYDPKEGSYLDNFELPEGRDLSSVMLKAYKITDPKGNPVKSFENLLPGYNIKPILKKVVKDPYANEYSLDVDWQCTKQNLTSNIDPDKVTAHLYKINTDTVIDKDNIKDIFDILDKSIVQSVKYPISYSLKAERDILRQVYLGEDETHEYTQKLHFAWDEPSKCAFDFFANAEKLDEETNNGYDHRKLDLTSLTGAGLKVGVIDLQSNDEPKTTRLDEIVGKTLVPSDEDKRPVQENVDNPELIEKMLQYCNLTSFAHVNLVTQTNDVRADLRLSYANSYHKEDERMVPALEDQTLNNLIISDSLYDMLNVQYNKMMAVFNTYTSDEFEEDLDNAEAALVQTSINWSLNTLLMGVCTGLMFLNPIEATWLAAICITAAASVGLQSWALEIMVDHKWKPTKNYAKQTHSLQQDPEVIQLKNDFSKMAKSMGFILRNENNEILLSDYKTAKSNFTNLAWSQVKPVVDWFENAMKPDGAFGRFIKKTKLLSISPEEYQEMMKEWDEDGKYTKQTESLNAISIVLDAINIILSLAAPEIESITKAIAQNGATAQAFEKTSISSTTKIIKNTKSLKKTSASKEFAMPVPTSEINEATKLSCVRNGQYRAIKGKDANLHPYDFMDRKMYVQEENAVVTYFKPNNEVKEFLGNTDLSLEAKKRVYSFSDRVDSTFETRVLREGYGTGAGANANTYENFMNDLTAINPDGTAKLPMGPEIYKNIKTAKTPEFQPQSLSDFLKDASLGRKSEFAQEYIGDFAPEAIDEIGNYARKAVDAATPKEFGKALDELVEYIGKTKNVGEFKPWTESTQIDITKLSRGQRVYYSVADKVLSSVVFALKDAAESTEQAYRLVTILSA